MKKTLLLISAALLAFPMFASAQGIIGECADCHTMHNSEQGQPVAKQGLAGTISNTPNQNLLKFDCIACHAQNTADSTVNLAGGSVVPQVYHTDTVDLAGGNFKYIADNTGRKGHNVQDLLLPAETDNINKKAIDNGSAYAVPPGQYYGYQEGHGRHLSSGIANGFDMFTCAGAGGCHGTRSQFVVVAENTNYTCTAADILTAVNGCTVEGEVVVIPGNGMPRKGIAAITGAHHESYDGTKDPAQIAVGAHDGAYIADSYRFLAGVKGYGNMTTRWTNESATSHNEYFGAQANAFPAGCNSCHVTGTDVGLSYTTGTGEVVTTSSRMTSDSTLKSPNQSISGFCTTCHGNFHSSSLEDGFNYDRGPYNGTSGAFLRHPSDYVIPASGEYNAYTAYNLSAPVARPTVATAASGTVTPGTDLVMCLSCHQAHATPNDGMLRFDYATMVAGSFVDSTAAQAAGGCMACHTTKGVNKQY